MQQQIIKKAIGHSKKCQEPDCKWCKTLFKCQDYFGCKSLITTSADILDSNIHKLESKVAEIKELHAKTIESSNILCETIKSNKCTSNVISCKQLKIKGKSFTSQLRKWKQYTTDKVQLLKDKDIIWAVNITHLDYINSISISNEMYDIISSDVLLELVIATGTLNGDIFRGNHQTLYSCKINTDCINLFYPLNIEPNPLNIDNKCEILYIKCNGDLKENQIKISLN